MAMSVKQRAAALVMALAVGFGVLTVGWSMDAAENARFRASERAVVTERLAHLRSSLEMSLNSKVMIVTGLEAQAAIHASHLTDAEFAVFAGHMVKDRPSIRSVQLAPDAVVRFVYPLSGNEGAVGLDLRSLPGQRETVERTIAERRFVLAGPVDLKQGGRGLIGRKPLYLPDPDTGQERFWGFATVILDVDAFMREAGWSDVKDNTRFALRGQDGLGAEGEVFLGDPAIFGREHLAATITFPQGSWQLVAEPVGGWHPVRPESAALRIAVAMVALLVGLGVWFLARLYFSEQHARDLAAEASRAKSSFMAKMSHELRTPLNAIIGFAYIMMEEALGNHGHPRYKEYSRDIHDSGSHLLELVNTILDMEKVEAGRFELHPEVFNPADLVPETLRLVDHRAAEGGVTLESHFSIDVLEIEADRRVTRQMLLNLLTNAVKFTEAGGTVTVRLARCDDGGLMLAVSDTGIGIAEEDIPTVLAPFGQVSNAMTRAHEGTGLGLPLTRALIEMHGGRMSLDSAPGIGTTITLCFPPKRVVGEDGEPQSKTAPDGAVAKSAREKPEIG